MFAATLSNDDFVLEANRLPWAVLDPYSISKAAHDAHRRGIPIDKLPAALRPRYRELVAMTASDDDFDPFEWMASRGPAMSFEVFTQTISEVTHITGHSGCWNNEVVAGSSGGFMEWNWQTQHSNEETPRWCYVTLAAHGLFLNDWASLDPVAYALIGYCAAHNLTWFSTIHSDVEDGKAETGELAEAVAEVQAHRADGRKVS